MDAIKERWTILGAIVASIFWLARLEAKLESDLHTRNRLPAIAMSHLSMARRAVMSQTANREWWSNP